MGSSKKHKDDKERKHKHKSRDHDRSRSRSKDRRRREEREKRSDSDKRKKRDSVPEGNSPHESSKRSHQDTRESKYAERTKTVDVVKPDPPRSKTVEVKPDQAESGDASGAGLSLSVAESNKLRAKLGLRPLEDGSAKKDDGSSVGGEDNDVHAPPTNMSETRKSEELREKMLQLKEKRRINILLGKVKNLADSDEDDSAVSWVKRSRKIDEERKKAEQMEKMLNESDSFGIGSLVAEEFTAKKAKYGSADLKGLKVEHALDGFAEERTTILVLKDKGILDDDDPDDTLINMNMVDDERASKNNETKKKKPDYKPYDEPEFDEYGMIKPKDILDKYNEEIDGVQKESFQLGQGGRYDAQHERQMLEIRSSLRQQGDALTLPAPKVASEYYSHEEMASMASFKKRRKKVRAIRERATITADDLLKMSEQRDGQDHGSRKPKTEVVDVRQESTAAADDDMDAEYKPDMAMEDIDMDLVKDDEDDDEKDVAGEYGPSEDLTGCGIDEDIASRELQISLNKARRIKNEKSYGTSSNATGRNVRVKTEDADDDNDEFLRSRGQESDENDPSCSIVLYSTSEFCRSLGDIPTYGQAGNRESKEDEIMEYEQELSSSKIDPDDDEQGVAGAWQSVEIDSRPVEIKADEKPVLDDEPVLNNGLAGALRLASTKGYLDLREKTYNSSHHPDMEAQNFSIEDKRYDDLDEKYNRKRDRYSGGATMDFKEKDGYKPIIKLEYVDEHGRTIPPKEAFRALSHRFHGKGSGKKKTEKRMKKVEEAELMKFMSSTDTPLNTVHLLKEKQKADRMPYVILSGGKGIGANNIAK